MGHLGQSLALLILHDNAGLNCFPGGSTMTKVSVSDSLSEESASTGAGPATTSYSDSDKLASAAVSEVSDMDDALFFGVGSSLAEVAACALA